MRDVDKIDIGFTLAVAGGVHARRVPEELDAVITGRDVEIEIDVDVTGVPDGQRDHRVVHQLVRPQIAVARIV